MKKIRKYALFIISLLIIVLFPTQNLFAQIEAESDDPEYWRAQGYVAEEFYGSKSKSVDYGISLAASDCTVRLGVDVSKYQGSVNWAKAKSQGVEYAIVRVGYRGSSTGALKEDEYYRQNIEGALAQGIPVGVYIFSQAITENEAVEEANYVLARIKQYDIELPIVIDYEYSGQNGADGRLYAANLSKAKATAVCKAFCKTVQEAGYQGMVYANKSMLNNSLNTAEIAKDYAIWLAHYTTATDYAGEYDFWQYTSNGDGATYGMQSQYVDLDYWYDDGSLYNAVYEGVNYSAVFNPVYYANKYPDLKEAYGQDTSKLLSHFVKWGMAEGRQAKTSFNVHSYKNLYEDLRQAYGSDLKSYYMHYIRYGEMEGRIATGYENTIVGSVTGNGTNSNVGGTSSKPTYITVYEGVDYAPVYDYNYYITKHPDVYAAFGNDENAVLGHFVKWGMMEGRQAKAKFNVHSYKNLYEDLRSAFGTDLKAYYKHYIEYGESEGRIATGSETAGTNQGGSLGSNMNNSAGAKTVYDGIDYSAVYDYSYYIKNHPDVYAVFGNDQTAVLKHFVECGMKEGRHAKDDFNVHVYRQRYEDLQEAYGSDLKSYFMHYINYGKKEGRIPY